MPPALMNRTTDCQRLGSSLTRSAAIAQPPETIVLCFGNGVLRHDVGGRQYAQVLDASCGSLGSTAGTSRHDAVRHSVCPEGILYVSRRRNAGVADHDSERNCWTTVN
jgi:hypothetical protein